MNARQLDLYRLELPEPGDPHMMDVACDRAEHVLGCTHRRAGGVRREHLEAAASITDLAAKITEHGAASYWFDGAGVMHPVPESPSGEAARLVDTSDWHRGLQGVLEYLVDACAMAGGGSPCDKKTPVLSGRERTGGLRLMRYSLGLRYDLDVKEAAAALAGSKTNAG